MKNIVGFAILIILLCTGSSSYSQNYEGGIRQVDNSNGLVTYEIKLVTLTTEAMGEQLDHLFMQKEGFVSAESSVEDRICTVVALHPLRKNEIADIVDFAGFEVAKSFTE